MFKRNSDKITLTFNCSKHGLVTDIEYSCNSCDNMKGTIETTKSVFCGKNYAQGKTQTNKTIVGTIQASGLYSALSQLEVEELI